MALENYNKVFETEHYIFHFKENSLAEKYINYISNTQENCYKKITSLLNIFPNFKIHYYLIDSPIIVGKIYNEIHCDGDDEPCNGFTNYPDTIYCVYNNEIKCIGLHEDTHIISYCKFRPKSAFLREGLAMYMDKFWHSKTNERWVLESINKGFEIDFFKLLNNNNFFKIDCNISYPLSGAFVNFICENFGIKKFLSELYYTKKNYIKQLNLLFKYKKQDMHNSFVEFIKTKSEAK